jgi:hypothetical protein
MKGLAWFARQIPTEGFSDVNEGRVGETEIPHSDQWIPPRPPNPDPYRPDKFNQKDVLKSRNKNASKTLIEELYQSTEHITNKTTHQSSYESGRYIFSYPSVWQSSSTVNKAIAVRRIETKSRAYLLQFIIAIEIDTGGGAIEWRFFPIFVQIPSSYTIYEALSAIRAEFKRSLPDSLKDDVIMFLSYNADKKEVRLEFNDTVLRWSIEDGDDDDILKLLNYPIDNRDQLYGYNRTRKLIFPNVPSREGIFLHASFVTHTSGGYLGRSGEFYPKPSKIYSDDGQAYFYIETSLDGYHRIPLPYENFTLELTFIIDTNDYLAE